MAGFGISGVEPSGSATTVISLSGSGSIWPLLGLLVAFPQEQTQCSKKKKKIFPYEARVYF
jgi:hypothetical protein